MHRPVCWWPRLGVLLGTHAMGVYKAMYTPENFKTAYSSFKSCKHECMVYTWYIPDIYMVYTIHIPGLVICNFASLQRSNVCRRKWKCMYTAWHFRTPTHTHPKSHVLLKTGYTMRKSRASLLSCPSALGSLRQGLPSELLSFGHREAAHTGTWGWDRPKFHNQVLIS